MALPSLSFAWCWHASRASAPLCQGPSLEAWPRRGDARLGVAMLAALGSIRGTAVLDADVVTRWQAGRVPPATVCATFSVGQDACLGRRSAHPWRKTTSWRCWMRATLPDWRYVREQPLN